MLDLAKVESGKVELCIEALLLTPLLIKCRQLITPQCENKGITLQIAGDATHVVQADALRLRQILLNLMSNGIKYNKTGGSLTIDVNALPSAMVGIAITDTGAGIAPNLINRLFQPFDRLDRSQHSGDGTGLGLALADRLTHQMNGRIEVDSTVGQGSTFTVVLPSALTATEVLR